MSCIRSALRNVNPQVVHFVYLKNVLTGSILARLSRTLSLLLRVLLTADLGIGRKIYVHINNTNPVLIEDSPERAKVEAAGWEVSCDGLEVRL